VPKAEGAEMDSQLIRTQFLPQDRFGARPKIESALGKETSLMRVRL